MTQIGTISKGTWIVIAVTEPQPASPGWPQVATGRTWRIGAGMFRPWTKVTAMPA